MGKIDVAGGGTCGPAVSMMSADDGREVVAPERDAVPLPHDAEQRSRLDRRATLEPVHGPTGCEERPA